MCYIQRELKYWGTNVTSVRLFLHRLNNLVGQGKYKIWSNGFELHSWVCHDIVYYHGSFNGICLYVVQGCCSEKRVQRRYASIFFYPMTKLWVLVSNEETSATQRLVVFLKVYRCIVNFVNLVRKQVKIVGIYIMQLSIMDSALQKYTLQNCASQLFQ